MLRTAIVLVGLVVGGTPARADVRGSLRVEVLPLDLQPSRDTPLFGDDVGRALDRYNAAAAAYDRSTGNHTPLLTLGDLALEDTLYVIAPGIDLGLGHYFLRLEAPIGLGSNLTSIGLGVYPLGLRTILNRRGVTGYLIAGGSASRLDRSGDGDVGALVVARAAVGVRFARYLAAELGYSPISIGGNINHGKLDNLTAADVMYLDHPGDLLAAGESHAVVDISVGVSF